MNTVIIQLDKTGTLSDFEEEYGLRTAESIKIIGKMNRKDLFYLRRLAGGCIDPNAKEIAWDFDSNPNPYLIPQNSISEDDYHSPSWAILKRIDLSEATIGRMVQIDDYWVMRFPEKDDHEELFSILYQGVFYESFKLEEIILPYTIRSIDENAFKRCVSLKRITIPDSVESIGDSSFSGCTSLENVILPKNLKRIYTTSFENCPWNYAKELKPSIEVIDPYEDRQKDNNNRIFLDSHIPFIPDKQQIIFIDKGNNQFLSEYFEENYDKVSKYFHDNGEYEFVFVPHIINMFEDEELCRYYRPSGNIEKCNLDKLKYHLIDDFIVHLANQPLCSSFIRFNCELPFTSHVNYREVYKFSYYVLEAEDEDSLWQDLDKYIHNLGNEYAHVNYGHQDFWNCSYADRVFLENMDYYTDKYKESQLTGITKYIADSIFGGKETLSRIHITKDLRIFLPDYGNMEIKMPSIAKAVYLLFLENPDGFTFGALNPYGEFQALALRHRLINICLHIIGRGSCDEVVTYVTNILGNPEYDTIDDCCGMIYEAFALRMDVNIAEQYAVSATFKGSFTDGRDGFDGPMDVESPKYIRLPHNLIEWEDPHEHYIKTLIIQEQKERKTLEESLPEDIIQERARQACALLDKLKAMPNGAKKLQKRIMSAHKEGCYSYRSMPYTFPSELNNGTEAMEVWKRFREYLDSCEKKLAAIYSRNWMPIKSNYLVEQYIDLNHKELPIISLDDADVETNCYSLLYVLNDDTLYDSTYGVPVRDIIEYSPEYIAIKDEIDERISQELEKSAVDADELRKDILLNEYDIIWIPPSEMEWFCGSEIPFTRSIMREPANDTEILDDICNGWNMLESTFIIKHLSEDFTYDSQWVLETLDADGYADYLTKKFSTLLANGAFVRAEIVPDSHSECGKMIKLTQSENVCYFRIKTKEGLISKGDLCMF